jgi:hypothetical protein
MCDTYKCLKCKEYFTRKESFKYCCDCLEDKRYENPIEDLIYDIEEQMEYVDIKPYSHNIISLNLRMIDEYYGEKEANLVIRELNLTSMGWDYSKEHKIRAVKTIEKAYLKAYWNPKFKMCKDRLNKQYEEYDL